MAKSERLTLALFWVALVQLDLGEDAKYLVLCSDGIFEFLSNEDIIKYVDQKASIGWMPSDIAKGLVCKKLHLCSL